MKTFTTSGTGSQQTLSPIETDKIPVYDSVTDAAADLANLAENQIIATHDTGSELSAPVDTVQSGNMHAVTSNAVFANCPRFPDYSKIIDIAPEGTNVYSWNATKDCFIQFMYWSGNTTPINLRINHNTVSVYDVNNGAVSQFSGYIKKGDNVTFSNDSNINRKQILKIFELQ